VGKGDANPIAEVNMKRMAFIVGVMALWIPGVHAGETDEARAYLDEARKKHYDPRAAGLVGFEVTLTLNASTDPEMMKVKEKIEFGYAWLMPEKEKISIVSLS
jgi:hypothetical protein